MDNNTKSITFPGYRGLVLVAMLGTVVVLFWHLYRFGGGPQTWDDLLYLDNALNLTATSSLVHRYFHILLLRLGIFATGDALHAARLYWSIMYVVTVLAIFFGAALLEKRSPVRTGAIAVALFLSMTDLTRYAGVVFTDFTLMMLVALACATYHAWVVSESRPGARSVLALLLIALTLVALFSKETGVILLPLVLIVSWESIRKSYKARQSVMLLGGLIVTLLFMLVMVYVLNRTVGLDGSILRDLAYGGLSLERLVVLVANAPNVELGWDSYWDYLIKNYPFLCIVFLLGIHAWKSEKREKLLALSWFLPFGLLVVLTFVAILTDWGIQPRYLYPALPVLAMWGALLFRLPGGPGWRTGGVVGPTRALKEKGDRSYTGVGTFLATVVASAWFIVIVWYVLEPKLQWLHGTVWLRGQVYEAIIVPMSVITILSVTIGVARSGAIGSVVLVLSVIALMWPPIDSQMWQLRSGTIQEKTDERFRWLKSLGEVYTVKDDSRIFISRKIYDTLGIGGRGDGSSARMMNVYYNMNIDRSGVVQGEYLENQKNGYYDLVFLTEVEWETIQNGGSRRCYSRLEPETPIPGVVLLELDEECGE